MNTKQNNLYICFHFKKCLCCETCCNNFVFALSIQLICSWLRSLRACSTCANMLVRLAASKHYMNISLLRRPCLTKQMHLDRKLETLTRNYRFAMDRSVAITLNDAHGFTVTWWAEAGGAIWLATDNDPCWKEKHESSFFRGGSKKWIVQILLIMFICGFHLHLLKTRNICVCNRNTFVNCTFL